MHRNATATRDETQNRIGRHGPAASGELREHIHAHHQYARSVTARGRRILPWSGTHHPGERIGIGPLDLAGRFFGRQPRCLASTFLRAVAGTISSTFMAVITILAMRNVRPMMTMMTGRIVVSPDCFFQCTRADVLARRGDKQRPRIW